MPDHLKVMVVNDPVIVKDILIRISGGRLEWLNFIVIGNLILR